MRIAMICFSRQGEDTGTKLKKALAKDHQVSLECKSRRTSTSISMTLSEWTEHHFADCDALVFIGSCGIAVRAIAPYVRSKKTDPAVIVLDEQGNFTISLLSGHLGGANALTLEIAGITGAAPVITTGTDVNGKLAPDVFAKSNHCVIDNMKAAAQLAAAILDGNIIHIYTDLEVSGQLPEYVKVHRLNDLKVDEDYKIVVSCQRPAGSDRSETMWIIPQEYILGIGCRRGTPESLIRQAVDDTLEEAGIDKRAICQAASIDLKADEEGLNTYCCEEDIPIHFFSEEELLALEGEFSHSSFVRSITGVDCVCERSACLAAGDGYQLIKDKTVHDKVTVAIARKKGILRFE